MVLIVKKKGLHRFGLMNLDPPFRILPRVGWRGGWSPLIRFSSNLCISRLLQERCHHQPTI